MTDYVLVGQAAILLAWLSQLIHTRGAVAARWPSTRAWLTRLGSAPWSYGGWNLADLLLTLLLVTFSGFRYVVGTDFSLYSGMYRRLDTSSWWVALTTIPQEPGFTLLRLVIKTVFGPNPIFFFLTTSALVVVPTLVAFKRLAPTRFALVVGIWFGLACYVTTFNGIRQALANALLLLAISLAERHLKTAVLIVAAACTLHVSLIVAAVLIAATWRWRPDPRRLALIVAGSALVVLVGLPFISPLLGLVNPRYTRYISASDPAGLGTFLQVVALVVLLVAVHRVRGVRGVWAHRWFVWSTIGVGLFTLGFRVVEFGRLHLYFRTFVALLLASVLSRSRHPVRDIGLVAVALLGYFLLHLQFYDDLLPYHVWIGYAR